MKENQTDHYFDEWWKRQMRFFVRLKSSVRVKDYFPKDGKIVLMHGSRMSIEPAPLYLEEWAERNPRPGIDRDKFIVALAKRVEALEAALALKGGAR